MSQTVTLGESEGQPCGDAIDCDTFTDPGFVCQLPFTIITARCLSAIVSPFTWISILEPSEALRPSLFSSLNTGNTQRIS